MFKIRLRRKAKAAGVSALQDDRPNLAVVRSVARSLLNGMRFVRYWQQQLGDLVPKLPPEEQHRFELLMSCELRPSSEELAHLLKQAQVHKLISGEEQGHLLAGQPIDIEVPLLPGAETRSR